MRRFIALLFILTLCGGTPPHRGQVVTTTPNPAQWQTRGKSFFKSGIQRFLTGIYYVDYTAASNNSAEQLRNAFIQAAAYANLDSVHIAMDTTNDLTVAAARKYGIMIIPEPNNATAAQLAARYPTDFSMLSAVDDMDHQTTGNWDKPPGCTGSNCGPTGVYKIASAYRLLPPYQRIIYGSGGWPARIGSFFGSGLDSIAMQCYPVTAEGYNVCSGSYWNAMASYKGAFVANVQAAQVDTRVPTGFELVNMSDQAVTSGAGGILYYTYKDTFPNDMIGHPELWAAIKDWVAFKNYGIPKPVRHFTLDDTAASTTILESAGNSTGCTAGRNASLFATGNGRVGTALDFYNGSTSDKLTCTALTQSGDFTMCAWLNPDTLGGGSAGRVVSANADGLAWKLATDGATGWKMSINAGNAVLSDAFSTTFDNSWHYACVTRSGSTCTHYKDGAQAGTPADCGAGNFANDLYLANKSDNTGYFDGKFDDVLIWSSALTAAQVSWLYSQANDCEVYIKQQSPTLYLEYDDSTTVTKNGSNQVATWASKVGSISFTQTTDAQKFVYTAGQGMYSDGAADTFMTSTATIADIFAAQGKTVFIVANFSTAASKTLLNDRSGFKWKTEISATPTYREYNDDGAADYGTAGASYTLGQTAVFESIHDATNVQSCMNGNCGTATASGATSAMTGTLGLSRSTVAPTGYWKAVITFNSALSALKRQKIRSCLGARYGVAVP